MRAESYGHGRSSDPNRFYSNETTKQAEPKKLNKKSSIVQVIGGAFKRTDDKREKQEKGIEMKDFNNIDHYVIDDEDVQEVPKRSEKRENRMSREVVFDNDDLYFN